MESALLQVNSMGLFHKIQLIRSNIANAWAMLFSTSHAYDGDKFWSRRAIPVAETGAD